MVERANALVTWGSKMDIRDRALPPMPLSELASMKALLQTPPPPAETTPQADRRKLLTSSRAMITRGRSRRKDVMRRAASAPTKKPKGR